ncbi:MAG: sulfotransferase family protein [Gaiellaceae bacterium]
MTLPTFIVIGVAKGGTTSIYRYLDQHPEIFMCPDKGPNYFGYEDARDWRWHDEGEPPLLRHFKVATLEEYERLFDGVTSEHAVGEVSPQYFRCPTAARRIHDVLPEAKLVASLRNPADRAFSGFLMRRRRGEVVGEAHSELTAGSSHVKEGFYFERMKRYYDLFDREQIKIYLFDEFKRSPADLVRDLFGFLGVDTGYEPDTTVQHNPANIPRSALLNRILYQPKVIRGVKAVLPERLERVAKRLRQRNLRPAPSFPPDLRAALLDLYRDDIHRLEELIERDLSVWFEPLPAR